LPEGAWRKVFDSSDEKWAGNGSQIQERAESGSFSGAKLLPLSFVVLERETNL
jgi:hypothetical protein